MRIKEAISNENAPSYIRDIDLVQLTGYHTYLNLVNPKIIEVNGIEMEIIDSKYDEKSGMEAFVIKDINDDENNNLMIVFIGSQQSVKNGAITHTPLLDKLTHTQIKEARTYFNYVVHTFGSVSAVAGNSLGGGLANAIGILYSDVRSVTLNPSMLPDGMYKKEVDYVNITNYFSTYDFLTSTKDTVDLGTRVPGNNYHINNELTTMKVRGMHGRGYVERIDDEYKVPIGLEGEAGHGFIYVGADDHIITSLWTGIPLYGGPATKLKINQDHMFTLAQGLEGKVMQRIKLIDEYAGNARDIVLHEHEQFNRRVTDLQEKFQDTFDELAGDPMLMGISRTASNTKSAMDQVHELLKVAKDNARVLQIRIDSKPVELVEYITTVDIGVASLFSPVKTNLENANDSINQFVLSARSVIDNDIPKLFTDDRNLYADAVTGELKNHYAVVNNNIGNILTQLDDFKSHVEEMAPQLGEGKANSISKNPPSFGALEPSFYLKRRMKIKKTQVNMAHQKTNDALFNLRPILLEIEYVLTTLNTSLKTIVSSIHIASKVALYGGHSEWLVNKFTNYNEKVQEALRDAVIPLEKMQLTVEGLKKAFARLNGRLPVMGDNMKEYIDTAIFEPGGYSNIRLYNIACSSILDEMELLFKDITFQLSGEKAEEIQTSWKIAEGIKANIRMLSKQVEKGTL